MKNDITPIPQSYELSQQLSQSIVEKRKLWENINYACIGAIGLSFILKPLLFPGIIGIIVSLSMSDKLKKQHTKLITETSGYDIISSVFPDAGYDPKGMSKKELFYMNFLKKPCSMEYKSSNFIAATCNNASFRYSDLNMTNGDCETFKGHIIKVQSEQLAGSHRVAFVSKKFNFKLSKFPIRTTTNFSLFDDNFKILSNGENDSAYIVTEKRINYILNLFTKSPKMCVFYDGPASSMYIMLEGKKLIKAPSSDGNMQDTTRKALERLHSIEQHIISLM